MLTRSFSVRCGELENKYTGYDKSATTPTLAAIYRPAPALSLYASYVEALEERPRARDTLVERTLLRG